MFAPRSRENTIALPDDPAYLVVDVETTGAGPGGNGGHRVIELAAVKVRGEEIVREFSTLLNPLRPLPASITQLTGITPESLLHAPRAQDIAPVFAALLDGSVFVAHNVGFDAGFLVAENFLPPDYPALCTVKLGRRLSPKLKSYNLDSLAAHHGVVIENRHRALGDARATAELFCRFLTRLRVCGFSGFAAVKEFEAMPTARARKIIANE